jgi:hypothetical protein
MSVKPIDAVWIVVTLAAAGIVWTAIARQHVSGWAVWPFAVLIFGIGAAWIRGASTKDKSER